MQYNIYYLEARRLYAVKDVKTTRCWGGHSLDVCIKELEKGRGWLYDKTTLRNYVLLDTISRKTHPEYFI